MAEDGALNVAWWGGQDIRSICARTRVLAFDLDNTLALSKTRMDQIMAVHFAALTRLRPVAIVSGGRFSQFRDQVLDALPDDTRFDQLHLMPSSWATGRSRSGGRALRDRGSQITFSALGQQAPVQAKEAWDPDNSRKDALARAVSADLPHLQVRSGGSTSVDISAKGIDKAYAVTSLARMLGVEVGDIAFVGDRMDPDGNDYPAALAGAMALRVHDPADALDLIRVMEADLD